MSTPRDSFDHRADGGGHWDDVVDSRTADLLRGALQREAAGVDPAPDGLQRIRARTADSSRRSAWLLPLAAAAAGVAVVGGVAWGALDQDRPPVADGPLAHSPTSPASAGASEPAADATPEGSSVAIPVYYVGEQPDGSGGTAYKLFREFVTSTGAQTQDLASRVDVALTDMFADAPLDPDYRVSAWPAGVVVGSTAVDAATGVITVDLGGQSLTGPSAVDTPVAAGLQQLVFTATAAAAYDGFEPTGVTLLYEGEPLEVWGVEPGAPLQRDTASFRAGVWILDVDEGETLSSPVSIAGEAHLDQGDAGGWQVLRGGAVVASGAFDTDECCSWRPYTFDVGDLTPGDYTVEVSVAGGDGVVTASDSKSFSVAPD